METQMTSAPHGNAKTLQFNGKILFIGYGSVARCTLPILAKHLEVPFSKITILDLLDKTKELEEFIAKGLTFQTLKIDKENLIPILEKQHLVAGDLLVDLAYEIDTLKFIQWCHERGVLYINASVEEWDPYGKFNTYEETLYYRHMRMREVINSWVDPNTKKKTGPTAVLDHGANPGLISHFVKQAIVDIANKGIRDGKFAADLAPEIKQLLEKTKNKSECREAFAKLAMKLDIKVIHCSERDTQITNVPKQVNEFVNTWSVEGLFEEGIAPAEMGWGTHEKWLPKNAVTPPEGPKNQIFLEQCGMNTWVRSFVPPNHQIIGMVIRHGEAFTISEYLTVWADKDTAVYRPTVHYAYNPCDQAIASVQELRGLDNNLQPNIRILTDKEIIAGADILGALVMGHTFNSWWTGSDLDIATASELAPGQNATTVQVAAGLLGAILWMIENPEEGVCLPDDLPYDYVLDVARPYLGNFISSPYDWTPLKHRKDLFPGHSNVPRTGDGNRLMR